jgi:ABC-2 type transport system permease protein
MRKILTVARTEYRNAVQSKAFIIGVVLMPVFMGGALVLQTLLKDKVDITDRTIAVIDRSGKLFDVIAAAAEERNASEIFDAEDAKKQVRPKFVPETVEESDDGTRLDVTLSNRVREKQLFAFVVIGADVFDAEGGADAEISYYTQTPTYRDLPRWIDDVVNREIKRTRFADSGIDRETVDKLNRSVHVKRLGLVEVRADGEVKEAERENDIRTFAVPAGAMFLLFMLLMMSAPALLNSVLEEKMQKISEVLVSSVTPFQLMMGKLIGTVFVSLTLSLLYIGAVVGTLYRFDMLGFVPLSTYFWFFLFQMLALLIFGSIFIGIGAACSEIRDAQSLMTPAMLMVMLPLFCWFIVLQSPSSPFSRIVSLVPPATPMLMLLRISVPPGPPWWEIVLSVVLTTAFAVFCVGAAGKVFRIGILSQGQAPSLARIVRWVFSR